MKIRLFFLLFFLSLFFQACPLKQKKTDEVLSPIRLLYSAEHCALDSKLPLALWISSEAEFVSLQENLNLCLKPFSDALSEVDFEKEAVILLNPGMKKKESYDIALSSHKLEIKKDTALIRLLIKNSPPSFDKEPCRPCTFIALPNNGKYRHVQLIDESGSLILKLNAY